MKTAQYSKKIDKLQSARNKVALFSHLFISCQIKEEDLEIFFSHENRVHHLYLSEHESFWPEKRNSSIIGCILQEDFTIPNEGPNISAKIFDGAAIDKRLIPRTCNFRKTGLS